MSRTVVDLDGSIVKLNLSRGITRASGRNTRSKYHIAARQLIKECFPTLQICEEITIPLKKGHTVYLDFFLPLNNKCIEVHGEQHYKFIPHFHQTMMGFAKHKQRDREKQEWCELNSIEYIELPYNEDIEQWKRRILNDEYSEDL